MLLNCVAIRIRSVAFRAGTVADDRNPGAQTAKIHFSKTPFPCHSIIINHKLFSS